MNMVMEERHLENDFDESIFNIEYDYSRDKELGRNPYDYMYLNKKIVKPVGLPKILDELVDQLVEWYDKGMYVHFESEIQNLEGYTKNLHVMNMISDDQARGIFKMFGWGW